MPLTLISQSRTPYGYGVKITQNFISSETGIKIRDVTHSMYGTRVRNIFLTDGIEKRAFRRDGQIWYRYFARKGYLEGEYKVWHEYGYLTQQEFYRNGEPEGEYKRWMEHGILLVHDYYINGNSRRFTRKNKHVFLTLKRSLYFRRRRSTIDSCLISDLAKTF